MTDLLGEGRSMFSNGDGRANERCRRKALTNQRRPDTDAKAAVLEAIRRIVNSGVAEQKPLANGDIELKLHSGEIFHLGEVAIARVG
jgi:hypothetical protein